MSEKPRKSWIDSLRALAMILVVYGHRVPGWSEYFVFTSPIKIPLFFAITGYVFNGTNGDVKLFFNKLLRTIIIPWLVLSMAPYIVAIPLKGFSNFTSHLVNILVGNEYWYMPCCIVAEIVWFFVLKYLKKAWQVVSVSVVLFIGGLVFYHFDVLSFFMINRALTVQIYLLIGWLFKRYESILDIKIARTSYMAIACTFYIVLGILSVFLYPGKEMDIHLNEYYNLIICQLMIWIGIGILFVVARKYVNKYPRWLVLIGQNTLVIYLLHSLVVRVCVKGFNIIHFPVNKLTNILLTAIVCAVCTAVSLAIKKFIPELMGRKKKTILLR